MWYTLAILSAIFSASASILEKKALQKVNPLSFSFILSIFNLILSLPFLYFANLGDLSSASILILGFKSILGASSFLLVMYGIKYLELSSALPLLVLTPGLVAIFAFIFLGEKLNNAEILGLILMVTGAYIFQLKSLKKPLDPFKILKQNKAFRFIVGALLIFTLTSLLDKTLLSKYKMAPEALIPLQHAYTFAIFAIALAFVPQERKHIKSTYRKSWKIILSISVLTIIYRYTYINAIKLGSVALVLAIKRTSVFFATLFGGKYFNENQVEQKALATAIMIAGAIVIIWN